MSWIVFYSNATGQEYQETIQKIESLPPDSSGLIKVNKALYLRTLRDIAERDRIQHELISLKIMLETMADSLKNYNKKLIAAEKTRTSLEAQRDDIAEELIRTYQHYENLRHNLNLTDKEIRRFLRTNKIVVVRKRFIFKNEDQVIFWTIISMGIITSLAMITTGR